MVTNTHVHQVPRRPLLSLKAASKPGKGPKSTPSVGRKIARFRVRSSLKTSVLPTQTFRGYLAAKGLFSVWSGVIWDSAGGQNDPVTSAIRSPDSGTRERHRGHRSAPLKRQAWQSSCAVQIHTRCTRSARAKTIKRSGAAASQARGTMNGDLHPDDIRTTASSASPPEPQAALPVAPAQPRRNGELAAGACSSCSLALALARCSCPWC